MIRIWNKSCYVALLVMVMFVLGACGSWEHSANAGETKLPEETETKVEEVQEETEAEVAPLLEFTVNECPSWDIFQEAWDVRGDVTYIVRDERDGATGACRFVIAGVDPDGNVVEEIDVDFEAESWMICGKLVAETDGTFTMLVAPPDSLNDDAPERSSHYLKVDAQGNVIEDILAEDYVKGILPDSYVDAVERGIRCTAVSAEGWKCVSLNPIGEYTEILVWNPQGEFVGSIPAQHYSWIMTSGSGKIYGIVNLVGVMVFTEILPESLNFAKESVVVPLDYLSYLQAGTEDGFIAMDRIGIVEFSLDEEPTYVLKFEDYGLDRQDLYGLQVRGDDILLIEHKMEGEKIPKLWTFQSIQK